MSQMLIVEDEEVLADALQEIFQGEGYQVRAVHNGHDALQELARGHVDVVLLDLMLPLTDGVTVLEVLRRDSPTTAVIVVTASARSVLKGHPVEGFLRKPFSLDVLLGQVKAVMRTRATAG